MAKESGQTALTYKYTRFLGLSSELFCFFSANGRSLDGFFFLWSGAIRGKWGIELENESLC